MREDQVSNGVSFLTHPKVQQAPLEERLTFLRNKGLTEEEIEEAVRRSENPDGESGEKSGAAADQNAAQGGHDPTSGNSSNGQAKGNGQPLPPHANGGPPRFQGLPPPSVDQSSSWVSKYLVPGTLALSAGAGMAFLYKTMVLKENMGGPRQWFGPGPPPPGVYPGVPVQQQQQQQQLQGQPMPGQNQALTQPQQQLQQQRSSSSLPGAPGAMEALLSQGKSIPSLEQLEKDRSYNKDDHQSTAMTTYDPSSSMFGSAPYGSAQGLGSDLMAPGFDPSGSGTGALGEVVKKQTELLQDVSSTLKSVTSQLADIKADRGNGGFGISTSGGTQAMIANLSQTTSDLKSELNTLKMLILSGKLGGSGNSSDGDGALSEEAVRKLIGPIDEKLSQQQQNKNQLDQLIKATSGAATDASDTASASGANQDDAQVSETPEAKTDDDIAQEKMHASRTALAQLVEACPSDKLRVAVNVLLLYLRNLVKDPDVPRYGRIARTNQSYVNNLSKVEHHMDLLKANGFEERNSGSLSRAPTLEWSEEWREKKDEWALRVLKDTIENLETVQKQGAAAAPKPAPVEEAATEQPPAPAEEAPKPSPAPAAAKPGFVAPPFTIPGVSQPPAQQAAAQQPQQQQTPAQQPQQQAPAPQEDKDAGAANGAPEAANDQIAGSYPLSYKEILGYVQRDEKPPGVQDIPNNLSSDEPTPSSMAPPRKPWENPASEASKQDPSAAGSMEGNPFTAFANGNGNGTDYAEDVSYPGYMGRSTATIEEINDDEPETETVPPPQNTSSAENGVPSSASALPFPEVGSASEVASAAPSGP
ncbi:Peroxisomal membrane protein PEX14 [Hondaea fermentalgiana]|uniref:Peroxisomal membrane protein PEX14 n=1 Tax=Hondaea fermentalgiana TaxID=2315210 RepID=A0A2R5G8J9_9STRA|nr:Peroxisomal membrane protein PEX14 [Hondaea fermentalgiana]|eukprot:GBG27382.1 Peroxisomal membrane protein PEX14 [Hondaea fermentalgiana]